MILSREQLFESLAEEDTEIIALAYAHVQYLKMYGIDIEKALYTAAENAEVMARVYQKGYNDAIERVTQEWQATKFLTEAKAYTESEDK